jgi:hypothetical protein
VRKLFLQAPSTISNRQLQHRINNFFILKEIKIVMDVYNPRLTPIRYFLDMGYAVP